MCESQSSRAARRLRLDERIRLPETVVQERLRSPTEGAAPPKKRLSPRRSLGIDDERGLQELKRKLSEVESTSTRQSPDSTSRPSIRESEGVDAYCRGESTSPTYGSKKLSNFHHVLTTSPVRGSSPIGSGNGSSQTTGSLRASRTVSSPPDASVHRSTPSTCAVVVADAVSAGDVRSSGDVTSACRSWKRQASFPQGEAPLVEEISSEQWEELLFRPAPLACISSAIVQEVDTDEGSDAGSVQTPGTPPRVAEAHITPTRVQPTASSPGIRIVEEETLHFAAEEQEHWGEEEWTEEEEQLPSPVPEHGSPGVMEGASERAMFSMLRPFGSVLRPTLGCLSPMTEEEEEQTEWGLSSAGASSSRGLSPGPEDGSIHESEPSKQESLTVREAVSEETSGSSPSGIQGNLDLAQRGVHFDSLPVEARESAGTGLEERTWSESLPVESRTRAETDTNNNGTETQTGNASDVQYVKMSWSLPNETRERNSSYCSKEENDVHGPNSSREREPPQSTVTAVGLMSPSAIARQSADQTVTVSESLPNQAKSKEKEVLSERYNESKQMRIRGATEVTVSESLPNATRVRDIGVDDQVPATRSVSDEARRTTSEWEADITIIGSSLPNATRMRELENSVIAESLPNESQVRESSPYDTEVVDRTDDKKYDFRALRIKRQQAQQAKKIKKEEKLKAKQEKAAAQTCIQKHSTETEKHGGHSNPVGAPYSETDTVSEVNERAKIAEDCTFPTFAKGNIAKTNRLGPLSTSYSDKEEEALTSRHHTGDVRSSCGSKAGHRSTSDAGQHSASRAQFQILADLETDPCWKTQPCLGARTAPSLHLVDNEPPSLVMELRNVDRFMTETLILTVEARGRPAPIAQWYFKPFLPEESCWTLLDTYMDGTTLETGPGRLVQQSGDRHRLVVGRLDYVDAGLYKVTLSNAAGHVSSQCKVVVQPISEVRAPTFFTPLVDRILEEGEGATFKTEVRGKPAPRVTWHKNGLELRSSAETVISENAETAEFSLHLPRTGLSDRGCYVCRATNAHGSTEMAVALKVRSMTSEEQRSVKRTIIVSPLSPRYRVRRGQTLRLKASVRPGKLHYSTWQVNGRPLVTSERGTSSEDDGGAVQLTVKEAEVTDAGRYQLTVDVEEGFRDTTAADVIIDDSIERDTETTKEQAKELKTPQNTTGCDQTADQYRSRQAPQPLPVPARVSALGRAEVLGMEADDVPAEEQVAPEESPPEEQPEAAEEAEPVMSAPEQAPESEEAPAVVKDTTPARTPDRRRSSAASDASRRRSSAATDPARRRSSAAADAEPPAIEVALTSARAVAGCPGRLEGKVSGRPRPTVGWTRDGSSVTPDGERIRCYHEEDGTFGLEIAECRPEDAGLYEATATNAHGSAATDAQLELGDMSVSGKEWAPDFTTPLLGGTFDEGGTIELDTHVTGVPIPEITWSKDGVPLDADERVSPGFDSDKATLSVKDVTTSDAGSYEITIRNKLGEVSSSVEVKVKKIYQAPVFIQQLTDVQQLLALDGKFTCKVSGIPAPDVQWIRNGEPIKSGRKCKIRRDGDSCTMTVRECEEEDAGAYTCRASNREATVDSTATLQVVDKLERKPRSEAPLFLKTVGDCEVFPGMQARFTACVAGYPEPEAEWFRNDVRLYPSERVLMEADGTGLVRLTLRTVDETDTGRYRLTVRNSEGSVSCEADLTYDSFEIAPTKPLKDQYQTLEKELSSGIPTQLAEPPIISKMVDRQLTLSWKPSATAGQRIPPTYIVEMAKMPDDDFTIVHHGVRGCSVEIKRLEPQCDYKFRVIAENKHGTSQPSPHVIAHRKDLVPPPEDNHPTLPEGETFRPGSSVLFPRGFDMEKHTGGRPHPPTFLRPESNLRYGVKARDVHVRWLVFGHPTPEVRVAFNNADLQMGGRYSLELTNAGELTLTIESMQERDQGVYEALCTNKYGEARQRMILQQTEMPRFLLHPEETTVMQKEQARFEARIACATPPKIQWFKDWRPLKSTKRIRILWREPDTSILLINDCLTPRDGGLYSVSATTASGTTSASAMLHIEYDEVAYSYISNSPARSVKPRSKAFEEFCDIGEELGRGTQGSVYHVVQRSNGCSFAAKAMNGKGDLRMYMNSEMWIMNQLHDRQLARLYDAYESPRQLILVQELCSGGDVLEALSRQPAYTESDVASVIHQVIWGLQYMHSKHIAHLGLTPGDILFLRPGGEEIKLIDFSLSRHINPERPERLDFGMPEFVAPEAVNGESVGLEADLWSVGIITYLLLSGTSPFRGDTDKETLERIQSGEMQFDLEAFSDVSDEAKDFISKLLVFPPAGRMDAKTALQHPWLKFAEKPPSGMKERPSEKLKIYTEKFRAWYRAASCRTWYRRRPFSAAFDHSSGMMYPPDVVYTPPPSPEPVRKELWVKPEEKEQEQEFSDEDELDWMGAESHYQQGPDTYLLQLRDIGLPSRLRQYIKVASERSPMFARRAEDESFYDRTLPVLHERRRYTDIMDEELDDERRSRISRYNADGGHYIPRRLRYELSARPKALVEAEAQKEQKAHGQFPFFREKPIDSAITEGQAHELTCLAIGNPKPIVQWFRNDVAIGETRRIRLLEDGHGRSVLRLQPAMDFDQGVYKAVCRNMVGQAVAKCRLYMGFEPGACDLPDVAEFSATEVLLRWKVPADTGGSPVLAYALQYKALIDHEWTDVADNIDHEFFCVGGLQPETNYHFRIKARNKFGWGSVSVPTPTVRTRKAEHWRRVEVSREERYLQQMTEAGRQPADPEALPELDYEAEENPVPLTPGSPEQRYTFLTEMHRGRFSLVAMCVNTENNQAYTAKLVEATEQNLEAAVAEYESLRSLRHERIAALFDAYKMDGKYVLVMEKLQGQDVLSFFADQHEYAEENVAIVVNQVLDGLQYLHWRGMAHLDLQPDNIVLSSHRLLSVKLVDLGSAQRVTRLGRMVRRSGNIEYTAPELLVDEPAFPMTDVWSLGCITYLLLSGTSPFLGADEDETRRNILYVRFRFDNLHKEITNEATRFMTMIFKRAPSKRPSCEECSEHRWLMSIEYMQKRRERAVFFGNRLKEYSQQYHLARERQATQNTDLIAAFTMDLIGAEPNL